MNYFKSFHLFLIPLVFLTTCHFPNFYPDPDDPGLSRFTSRGGSVASNYINGRPYRNRYSYDPLLIKDSTGNAIDTLRFTWELDPNDSTSDISAYKNICFLLPVPQFFNKNNLLAFNGQRFEKSVPVALQDSTLKILRGTATLYFVSVVEVLSPSNEKYVNLSGLFDGNIGDSVSISKGRFDFQVPERQLNF